MGLGESKKPGPERRVMKPPGEGDNPFSFLEQEAVAAVSTVVEQCQRLVGAAMDRDKASQEVGSLGGEPAIEDGATQDALSAVRQIQASCDENFSSLPFELRKAVHSLLIKLLSTPGVVLGSAWERVENAQQWVPVLSSRIQDVDFVEYKPSNNRIITFLERYFKLPQQKMEIGDAMNILQLGDEKWLFSDLFDRALMEWGYSRGTRFQLYCFLREKLPLHRPLTPEEVQLFEEYKKTRKEQRK